MFECFRYDLCRFSLVHRRFFREEPQINEDLVVFDPFYISSVKREQRVFFDFCFDAFDRIVDEKSFFYVPADYAFVKLACVCDLIA